MSKKFLLILGVALSQADHWGYLEEQANGAIKGKYSKVYYRM